MKKVVIKVAVEEQKSRAKVMKILSGVPGLVSVDFADQNHIVLIGNGIDAAALTMLLRKKVGSSDVVSVGLVDYGGNGDGMVQMPVGGYYSYNPHAYGSVYGYETTNYQNPHAYGSGHGYETRNENPDSCCSIL